MSKKNKHARELERLSKLYQPTAQTAIGESPSTVVVDVDSIDRIATNDGNTIVRRDLMWLTVIVLITLGLLFGVNYLVDHSAVGTKMLELIGKSF